jgi:hypothetical protein
MHAGEVQIESPSSLSTTRRLGRSSSTTDNVPVQQKHSTSAASSSSYHKNVAQRSASADGRRQSLGLVLSIKPPPSLARYGIDIEIDEKEWKRKNAPQIEVVGSFWNQISGHRVVLKARNGYICKPLYPRELWFYLSLQSNPHYRPFAPTLFGCVELTRDQLKALVGRVDVIGDAGAQASMEEDIRKKMERGEVASWSRYLESQLVGKLERESNGESKPNNALLNYIVLEDITHGFRRPCVLDIKVRARSPSSHYLSLPPFFRNLFI